jgi:hypothetical protein
MVGANDWMKQVTDEYEALTDQIQEYSLERTSLGLALDKGYTSMLRIRHGGETATRATEDAEANVRSGAGEDPGDPYLLKRGSLYRADKRTFTPRSVPPAYVETLGEIAALCRQHSVTCVFATQPNGYKQGISPELASSRLVSGGAHPDQHCLEGGKLTIRNRTSLERLPGPGHP